MPAAIRTGRRQVRTLISTPYLVLSQRHSQPGGLAGELGSQALLLCTDIGSTHAREPSECSLIVLHVDI